MPGRRAHYLLPLLAGGLFSCAELPTIEEARCGNGFIEAGEDCDDFGAVEKKSDTKDPVATCNAPGVANQCRFHCEDDAQCQTAPVSANGSGWRCGVDKVCREPQGDDGGKGTFFTPVSSLIPGGADELFTGDFDGDGRRDLLAVEPAGFDVHYFTRDAGVAKSLHVPGAPILPAIGKLTATAADDFTIDVAQGIGVMLGRLGQTIEPSSYTSLDVKKRYQSGNDAGTPDDMRLLIVDIGATVPDDKVPEGLRLGPGPLALSVNDGALTLIDASADPASQGKVVIDTFMDLAVSPLFGPIPVSFLGPKADRQRFVLAFRSDTSVHVIDAGATAKNAIRYPLDLPQNFTVHGAAFFADVNGDGFADVLVGGADCSQGPTKCSHAALELAYGDGKGEFFSALPVNGVGDPLTAGKMLPYLKLYPEGEPQKSPPDELGILEMERYLPLAVGRFDAAAAPDAAVDYVNAFGIFVSDGGNVAGCALVPNTYCQADRPSGGELWSEARIGDFNTNGRLDVAAVSRGNPGIDFFSGTGNGVFNSFSIPTAGVPSDLAVGDFDGDFLPDLAFDSVTSKLGGDAHTLSVAFGHASGAPELPVSMGEVTNLHQIVSGNLSLFGNDAASDIVLLSGIPASLDGTTKKPGSDWKVGLSQGNGYRQLQAPLIFFAKRSINVDATPLASAIGLFDGDPGSTTGPHADVAAVVQSFKPKSTTPPKKGENAPYCMFQASLWMLPATADAAIEPPADDSRVALIATATSDAALPDNFLPLRRLVETVPISLDGGSTESLLITFPTYDGCDPDITAIGAHGELLLARFDADGQPHLTQIIKSVGDNEFLIRVRVGDIDGDGVLDIAALKVKYDLSLGRLVETQVVVLRGDGKGSFEAPLSVPVDGVPVDVALVNADGESDLELVVVSAYANPIDLSAELFVIDWDKSGKDPTHPFNTLLPRAGGSTDSSGGSVLDRPTALAGGDFDGDGVDDVAVAIAGGIRMFKGVSR
jgi:VCBS repeat protein